MTMLKRKFGLGGLPPNDLITLGAALGTGTAGAIGSANEGDPIGTVALKSLAAGAGGALAGRYAAPLAAQGIRTGASFARDQAVEQALKLRGTGALTAAAAIPVTAAAGALAYQGGRALNVPLDVARTPGFQNAQSYAIDQANAEYEDFIQREMEMAYMNQPIDPEQIGLSSNTLNARMGMG